MDTGGYGVGSFVIDLKYTRNVRLPLVVLQLTVVKIYKIAMSGNTGAPLPAEKFKITNPCAVPLSKSTMRSPN